MKKNLILYNLKKNSYSAFSAAIEIHNKPNIDYRYETVTILLLNAWELILKAFVKKYTRKNLFKTDNYSISLNEALCIVKKYLQSNALHKKYISYFENIELLEEYRNSNIHFYNEKGLDAVMFSLIAKSTLDYNQFCYDFFKDDPLGKSNLTILPIGFKLPFSPEHYLSFKNPSYNSNADIKAFMDKILLKINNLRNCNVDESIVVGFEVYLSSVKKITNSDLIVAIDQENADVEVNISKKVEFTNEKGATKVNISDEDILKNYPLTYDNVWKKCKEEIKGFKKDNQFQNLINSIQNDLEYCYIRKFYLEKSTSNATKRYTNKTIDYIKANYIS